MTNGARPGVKLLQEQKSVCTFAPGQKGKEAKISLSRQRKKILSAEKKTAGGLQ